jgi:hypothetical protein
MHHPDTRAEMEAGRAGAAPAGWGALPCPRCSEVTTIAVDLDDLTHFRCASCEENFFRADLEAIILAWPRVLRWLDLTPRKE